MSARKVAAIVSAYYAEKFLKGRIENLLEQEISQWIVVVCQEKSIEEEIALRMGKPHDIQVITTHDIPTVYHAWNIGIQFSQSEYIVSANSDDRFYPGGLRLLAKTLDKYPDYVLSYADVDRVKEIDGKPFGRFEWAEGGLDELLQGCFLGPMPMWRRSLHEAYGMFDASFASAGDYEFWLRLAAGGEKFRKVHAVCGAYLDRKDSVEHRSSVRSTWETSRARAMYRTEGVPA